MSMAGVILYSLLLYAVAGVVTALAFVSVGLAQIVHPATLGARILLLPGAFALWPYIVWPILALLVALGVLLALWLRPPPDQAAVPSIPLERPA
jgi:hypothetical protein